MFTEDLFIKSFFFTLFTHAISTNKHFISSFFSRRYTYNDMLADSKYSVLLNKKAGSLLHPVRNKHYVSNVFICRYIRWIFIYMHIYNNLQYYKKITNNQIFSRYNCDSSTTLQIYNYARQKYLTKKNNISKKILSINQSHTSIEYANLTLQYFKQTLYAFGSSHIYYFFKKFEQHPQHLYNNLKKK